jgi:hypothetical protein
MCTCSVRLKILGGRGAEGGLEQAAVGDALLQRVGDRARLLVDLLEHEVPVLALLGGIGRQLAVARRALDRVAVAIEHLARSVRRTSATSPSSRNMKRRVTGSSAETSEATKFSSTPRPITTGQPSRARISRSGSFSLSTTSA